MGWREGNKSCYHGKNGLEWPYEENQYPNKTYTQRKENRGTKGSGKGENETHGIEGKVRLIDY